MDKLYGNVLGVCTAPTSAKGDEFAALVEALRHVVAGQSNGLGLIYQGQTRGTSSLQAISRYVRECRHPPVCARTVHCAISS